jgi:Ran GTPase-activating protein (RanGAP) involved in mRNA processing and transport
MSVLAGERDRNIAETYVAKEHMSQYLQKLLANDTSCTECRVLGFELSPEELQTLAYALTENKHMKALSLDHLKIGDDGAKHIAQGICYNQSLTFLSLRWNNIGNEGGVALAEALHYNTTIKHLVLSFNRLGHSAGKAFATAITANNTLESLELKWNQIDDEAGDLLLDALSNNKGSLSTLLLGGNGSSLRNTRKDGIGKNANRSKSMRFLSRRQEGKKTEGTTVSLGNFRFFFWNFSFGF